MASPHSLTDCAALLSYGAGAAFFLFLLMLRFLVLLAFAAPTALPISAQTFSEPLALKVGWNTQALFLGDIDRDGHQDMAMINNDRSRIVMRYGLKAGEKADSGEIATQKDKWDPILEDAPYLKNWVTTGVSAFDLHFADLNGDQKLDMIYTTDRDQLVVQLQKEGRTWAVAQTIRLRELKNNWLTLASADLDADGDLDLALLGSENIFILKNEKGELQKPTDYPCTKSDYNLQLRDLNGDSKIDLIYQDPEALEVLVRLQQDGGFPVEQVLGIDSPGIMVRFDEAGAVSRSSETNALERYELRLEENNLSKSEDVAMFSYSLGETRAEALHHQRVDLDQDGDLDLIVADEKSAELSVYLLQPNGRFTAPIPSATVNGIKALTVSNLIPGGNPECAVYSEEESMIGIATLRADGSLPFPNQIPLENTPTSLSAGDLNGDGTSELIVTSENHLHVIHWEDEKWNFTSTKIESIGSDRVTDLRPFDIDQNGRLDLLVILERDPMKILLQQEDGTFKLAEKQSGFAEKLTNRLNPSAISAADVDGDGNDELLLCRETFMRAIRLNSEGQLQVVSQINLKKKKISLQGGCMVNVIGDQSSEFLVYDKKGGTLEVCDVHGESLASLKIPLSEFAAIEATESDIFLYGEGKILRIPLDQKLMQAVRTHTYQTTLKDMNYIDFRIGDFNTDGKMDAVVIDSRGSHILEVLLGTDEGWETQQHFILFEVDRHYRGKRGSDYQPRDIHLHDTNGDGKLDLVLHIHDRILTYLQQ